MGTPTRAATRQRLASREDTILTTFALPRPLHRRLMRTALDLNWTGAEVLRTATEEWLSRHASTITRRAAR